MIKLSERMQAVSSMVTKGNVLCDVGTDHGYVPIALLQSGVIPKAIAMDINQGPLDRANAHIAENHLEDYITTRLSDGVAKLSEGEADTILIAGMGGMLVIHILEEGKSVCESVKELILQPQSEIHLVRKYLRENGYKIVDEDMILEDGKYYPMMRVIPKADDRSWQELDEKQLLVCDLYGPILLKNGNLVLRKYLVWQNKMLTDILEQLLSQPGSEKIEKRIQEVREEIACNESAYGIMGEIKNAGLLCNCSDRS